MKCRQDDAVDNFEAKSRLPIQETNFDDNHIVLSRK